MSDKKEVTAKNKKAEKKPGFFKRTWQGLVKGLVNMKNEVKKISWPPFSKVVKQTGVVLGVVLLFLIVITLCDLGLQFVLTKITGV